MREKLLDFVPICGSHTGVTLALELLKVLKATKTKHWLLRVIADNASNIGTLCLAIKVRLLKQDII